MFCDYKMNEIYRGQNRTKFITHFSRGEYQPIEGVETYVRLSNIGSETYDFMGEKTEEQLIYIMNNRIKVLAEELGYQVIPEQVNE